MEALPSGGAMVAVAASEAEVAGLLGEGVGLAAVNGPARVHAEVACIPRLLVARIPARPNTGESVPFDEAAFATLGAVALHGIRTSDARLGDLVAVIGLGLLGQLTVQLLKAAGCRVVGMDIDASRANLARSLFWRARVLADRGESSAARAHAETAVAIGEELGMTGPFGVVPRGRALLQSLTPRQA